MTERKEVALITGASSGIGQDIARILAEKKIDLIITARRRDRLDALAKDLRTIHNIQVDVIESDLAKPDGAVQLYNQARAISKDITIVVNNAGFGKQNPVLDQSIEEIRSMIQVNMTSLTELTRLFAADMKAQGYGRILQLSSIGAFQPSPIYAVYSAAKSYVLSFSYAMNHELKGSGVSITTMCPGITETEFHDVAGHEKTGFMKSFSMTSRKVAEIGVRAMMKRKANVIPGFSNAINSWLMESMPRAVSTSIAASLMKKS
ncbi:MAG TPA: SDR family oxidoreductase [Leptospiraceae bacterium]|nr:SDR family oxidoreductase [Leptospiraceae bacterium]HMY45429.1 SDR family oxidoreductase [Leptospiraceae bacterium]HMZ35490.1 SDR family oxidoreductase [Leptospiraceae bacterium]HNE23931.1 SDR family oxidoreductase [Leptospiraceae bacterium]HNL00447.1 SDR family oxidoreductase [Leptospiraceae bacterium]